MKPTNIKTEKANTMFKNQILKKLTNMFRIMEMFFFLALVSNYSSHLPSTVNFSVDHFKTLTTTVFSYFSPKLVFVVGNLIILTLYLKSKADENGDRNENDVVKIKSYDMGLISHASVMNSSTCDNNIIIASSNNNDTNNNIIVASSNNNDITNNKRRISRSKSENRMKTKCREKESHRELRRSVTGLIEPAKSGDVAAVDCGEKVSGDEFRRTVEAFIARRQKLLRDEEFSPMVYIGS